MMISWWCVFHVQGRPGPKGDVGDGGLPGQKVGDALGCFDFTTQALKLLVALPENGKVPGSFYISASLRQKPIT